jgi:LmbE family N-acetylglucosaminyl deacetylase
MLAVVLGCLFIASTSSELHHRIERAAGSPRLLYVAAHPDDENTRLLAWAVHHEGAEAAYLSLTRGEGGQNLIGPEQAPLLGVIRTQELLAARRIDGARQFFGTQADFGYSKSHEEALRIWGQDDKKRSKALADVVWVIRSFRPDVIVTRFSPEGRDTHGHHTASAIVALEAFKAAADPKVFPEQLQWVQPWQAKRIVWNRGFWGSAKPEETAGLFAVDVGGFDSVLGESYPELAARSRSMHKSQGFGATPQRGKASEYFKLLGGAPLEASLFDGVARAKLDWPRDAFSYSEPWRSVPALLALPRTPALDEAIVDAAGLYLDASVAEGLQVEGLEEKIMLTAVARTPVAAALTKVELLFVNGTSQVLAEQASLEENVAWKLEKTFRWPANMKSKTPERARINLPMSEPPAQVRFTLRMAERDLVVVRPLERVWNDPVMGERRAALTMVPPVTLTPRAPVVMLTGEGKKPLHVRVRASRGAWKGRVKAIVPGGLSVTPSLQEVSLAQAGDEAVVTFEVSGKTAGVVRFSSDAPGLALTTIDYPHIPPQHVLSPSEVKVVPVDLKKAGTRIGYIAGAGDDVASCLRQVGYDVMPLSLDALERDPLDGFDAIVLGVRAFNTHPRLNALKTKLWAFADAGGTVMVQYNTSNFLGALNVEIGPYPITISQERVTEEDAAVKLRDLVNPILIAPNQIVQDDFKGWVHERGLYFAGKWDDRYSAPFAMHDQSEPERGGSLLVAPYGKGRYVYTGLSFFRQLPAGVPGAYRLFANLIGKQGVKP